MLHHKQSSLPRNNSGYSFIIGEISLWKDKTGKQSGRKWRAKASHHSFCSLLTWRPSSWLLYDLRNNRRTNVPGNHGRGCKRICARFLSLSPTREWGRNPSYTSIAGPCWKRQRDFALRLTLHWRIIKHEGVCSLTQRGFVCLVLPSSLQRCWRLNNHRSAYWVFNTFVPALYWFSDHGSYFKNQVTELLANSLGAKQKFWTKYLPLYNGTIEAVWWKFLRIMRQFSADFRIPEADRPISVTAIQSTTNNTSSRRLGSRSPITAHTGMDSGTPINLVLNSMNIS